MKAQSVLMYSTSWCGDCHLARKFFAEHNIAFTEIDIERQPEAAEVVVKINGGYRSVPTIVAEDGQGQVQTLTEPTWSELEAAFLS